MANGLKIVRERAGATQKVTAGALNMSVGGYRKIENGERKLAEEVILRACEFFGVSPNEIIGPDGIAGLESAGDIDPATLADLVSKARLRLGSLPEIEARNLVLALISGARKPRDRQVVSQFDYGGPLTGP